MVCWSSLGRVAKDPKFLLAALAKLNRNNDVFKRSMSGHGPEKIEMVGSRWQWHKFKDTFHFYFMLGAIWTGLLIGYCNVFIGPAQLAPIPEGYEPKHWEYHRHPISRFISRYMIPSPQQEYEKYLHLLSEQKEKQWRTMVTRDVNRMEGIRKDFKGNYYHYVPADSVRITVDEINDRIISQQPVHQEHF